MKKAEQKGGQSNIKNLFLSVLTAVCLAVFLSACSGGTGTSDYTVTFETNGGNSIASYVGADGEYIENLADPVKDEYIFGGWYFDADFNEAVEGGFFLNKDVTLYARWGREFDISFNVRGGEDVASIKSKPFEANDLTDKETTKAGNVFAGWYYDEVCTNAFNPTNQITGDITLYAGWQDTIELTKDNIEDYFDVTTDIINSSVTGTSLKYTVELKDAAYLESLLTTDTITLTVEYGSFVGSTRIDCSTDITLNKASGFYKSGTHRGSDHYIQVLMGSLTKYANVTLASGVLSSKGTDYSFNEYEKYQIIYQTNGGGEIPSLTVNEHSRIVGGDMPVPTHSNENLVFGGWFTDGNLTAQISNTESITVTENKTFYAKWIEVFDIDFNSNGGNEIQSIKSNAFGATVIGSDKNPAKRGSRFMGWFCDEDCTTKYDSSAAIIENITLYAGWKSTFELVGTISEAPSNFFIITTEVVNSATEGTYLEYDIKLRDDIYLDGLLTTDVIELEIYYQVREGYTTTICSATASITLSKTEGFNKVGTDYGNSQYIIADNNFNKIREKGSGYTASINVNTSTNTKFISGVLSSVAE